MDNPEDKIKDQGTLNNLEKFQDQNTCLLAQLQITKQREEIAEVKMVYLQQQLEDAQRKNIESSVIIEALSIEKSCLKKEIFAVEGKVREREEELLRRLDDGVREKDCLEVEIYEGVREREELVRKIDIGLSEKEEFFNNIEALKEKNEEYESNLSRGFGVLGLIKECLVKVNEDLIGEEFGNVVEYGGGSMEENLSNFEGMEEFLRELDFVLRMAKRVEDKMNVHLENVKKEKRELERSVMSLTEENRDANALLRIALVEKEAVERSVTKLKGNNEQRRSPLLQFAERGLQTVGFGFIIGGASTEQNDDQKKTADQISDSVMSDVSSECEEEVVSLASTVEKMMKNQRLEITQLKRDLEDSRSDNEWLQSLTEKQARQINEQVVYIKELEDRNRILIQNVEGFLVEIKASEEEAERWREACELEVAAGKHVSQEHNKVVAILKQEIEKTRTALQVSNKKLKLKEEVVAAAMAAQSAAERSLQLADSRIAGLRERIEELTKQVEEVESRHQNNRRRKRRLCWPWQIFNPANAHSNGARNLDFRRVPPEMQAFIQ